MAQALLSVRGLSASAGEKPILHNIDLDIEEGTTHVLMGPNGAGKSTLGQVIAGNLRYAVTSGAVTFAGEDITDLSPHLRSRAGLFLSFQAPVEVPGVPYASYLRALATAHEERLGLHGKRYKQRLSAVIERLGLPEGILDRELNVGFSGGERKKLEMLQLLLLQPKLAILDETDSGLDVDALGIVSQAIAAYREECAGTVLVITHNTRILERLTVDRTHVMVAGRIVAEGDASLITDIDAHGFEQFGAVAASAEGAGE